MSVEPYAPFPPGGPYGQHAGDPEEVPNPNAEMAIAETAVARPDIESDTRVIAERIFDRLAERAPGWIARDGNLEVWLIEEFSTVAAEIRGEANTVPEAIFQTYGEEVLGIPIRLPDSATGRSTWTALDAAGYMIPPGTQVTLARTGDELIAFEVVAAAQIEPGSDIVTDVELRALEPGAAGNGLAGPADVIDPLRWVDTIEVETPTAGGADGQTLEEYLTELIMLMRVVAIRPILPWDFAVLALRVPGVARAIAMDGYEPSDGTWGHVRQVTLVLTDQEGKPCPDTTKDLVRNYLESLREVNWIIRVIDATYQTIAVTYEVTAFVEQDPDVVVEACTQAVTDALSPALFRLGTTSPAITAGEVIPPPPPYGEGGPTRQTLRVNDFIGLLDRQRGVDWVDTVELDDRVDDLTLTGPTTLPRPGRITGTVNTRAMVT